MTAPKFDGPGTYRNACDAVMVVEQFAGALIHQGPGARVLGSIYLAHAPDELFGPTNWLVTPEGMESAGYVKQETGP